MLNEWLNWQPLTPNPYTKFVVIHVDHNQNLSQEVRQHLQELLIRFKVPESLLQRINSRLKWDENRMREQLISRTIPVQSRAKRGEFGEILICALLQQFLQFSVPVPKLWFKFTSGQSLPATDALAIKTDNAGNLQEVCYIESKLRTGTDTAAAIEAANQLFHDTNLEVPDILRFVLTQLDRENHVLADKFVDYLADRGDTRDKETYYIGLCWERDTWDNRTLEYLEAETLQLERLSVSVIRIHNLGNLTDELFRSIGISEVEDND
jgi:hypothetical protein